MGFKISGIRLELCQQLPKDKAHLFHLFSLAGLGGREKVLSFSEKHVLAKYNLGAQQN